MNTEMAVRYQSAEHRSAKAMRSEGSQGAGAEAHAHAGGGGAGGRGGPRRD